MKFFAMDTRAHQFLFGMGWERFILFPKGGVFKGVNFLLESQLNGLFSLG